MAISPHPRMPQDPQTSLALVPWWGAAPVPAGGPQGRSPPEGGAPSAPALAPCPLPRRFPRQSDAGPWHTPRAACQPLHFNIQRIKCPPPLPHPCNNITEGAEQQAAGHGQAAPAAERPAPTLVWANSHAGATHAEINSTAEAVVKG